MMILLVSSALCPVLLICTGASASVRLAAAARTGSWRNAEELPGLAALNKVNTNGYPLTSESCASAGNCVLGGSYSPSKGHFQAFVASEQEGYWGKAQQIPGLAALNTGDSAGVNSVSCASAGNCAAVGTYAGGSPAGQRPFVASEKNGVWGKAQQIPGLAALNTAGDASAVAVSCAPGKTLNCAVGGFYYTTDTTNQAFVAGEKNGVWGQAQEAPGTAALNQGDNAGVSSVSCPSAGNCTLTGTYEDGSRNSQAFVAGEKNGVWGQAQEIPGTAALNTGGSDQGTVSCASAGNCVIGGSYSVSSGESNLGEAFVANEKNGVWGSAQEVPGTAALNQGGGAGVVSVSCPPGAAGDCAAAGSYLNASRVPQAFVAGEQNGVWRQAQEIPGTAALNQGTAAGADSLSCGSAGDCSVVGDYLTPADQSGGQGQAFLADESNGVWQKAEEIPGTAALAKDGRATPVSVSCTGPVACGASGVFNDHESGSGPWEVFVLSRGA
jgi:hypothetical protein